MRKKLLKSLVIAAIGMAFTAGSAWALPQLQLNDGTNTLTIVDGGAGDSNPTAGVVGYAGTFDNWTFDLTATGYSTGTATAPDLDLLTGWATNSNNTTSTMTVALSDNNFGPVNATMRTDVGGTTDGSMTLASYYDTGNTDFVTGTLMSTLGPFSGGAFSGTDTSNVNLAGPFSLTMVAKITQDAKGTTSFDSNVAPAPEPGTMLLFGLGLAGLFGISRKRLQGLQAPQGLQA